MLGSIILAALLVSAAAAPSINWESIRVSVANELSTNPNGNYDNTLAPLILRLAWHSAATYDPLAMIKGGVNNCPHGGATMRFEPESAYYENARLDIAREAMENVESLHPELNGSHVSDLWVLASYVAIEEMGGPRIEFREGRNDAAEGGDAATPEEERIPAHDDPHQVLREKFARLGMSTRDFVALMGAHSVGYTNPSASGFPDLHWDVTAYEFDNRYYQNLLAGAWYLEETEDGLPYYLQKSWIMMLSDYVIKEQPDLEAIGLEYAVDQQLWFDDFASAFKRLTEMGMAAAAVDDAEAEGAED